MNNRIIGPAVLAMSQAGAAAIILLLTQPGCSGAGNAAEKSVDSPAIAVSVDAGRGRLLYETQCVSCHTTQAHWRSISIVGSWSDVLFQVDRWQQNAGQKWGTTEIGDVAAYLNTRYYNMPCTVPGCRGETHAAQEPILAAAGIASAAP